jgi:zeaxanthin glucosyltransferase
MPLVAFFIGSASSHYKATFQVAKRLKENQYHIVYAGESQYQKLVEEQGFEFCFFPTIIKPKPLSKKQFLHSLKGVFSKNTAKHSYDAFLREVGILGTVLSNIKPDMVLFDAHLSMYALLFPEYKTGIVQTMISTDKGTYIPPLNSKITPNTKSLISKVNINFSWKRTFIKRNIIILLGKIMHFGQDNFSLFLKRLKNEGYDGKKLLNFDKSFHPGINGIPEFIFTPAEFDFPWKEKLDNQYFVGPSVDMTRKDVSIDNRYVRIMENVMKVKEASENKVPLIYCSLGTLAAMSTKYFGKFMDKMVNAFKDKPHYQIIISLGYELPEEQLPKGLPPHIHFLSFVPQLDILSKCDLMITAPGINSIKECIMYKVPMLLYAYNKWDHHGNAARAEYHGLGLKGDMKKDSSEEIYRKTEKVINEKSFQENIDKMSEIFHQYNNSEQEVSIFNKLIGEKNLKPADYNVS